VTDCHTIGNGMNPMIPRHQRAIPVVSQNGCAIAYHSYMVFRTEPPKWRVDMVNTLRSVRMAVVVLYVDLCVRLLHALTVSKAGSYSDKEMIVPCLLLGSMAVPVIAWVVAPVMSAA
jgi:hypothetical protein